VDIPPENIRSLPEAIPKGWICTLDASESESRTQRWTITAAFCVAALRKYITSES
jgi:hypothetical protein